jgi:PilZ domain
MDGSHENRRATRSVIAKAVQIATGTEASARCRTKDLSTTGVRLIVHDGWSVPDVFLLVMQDDLKRWCQVVWRSGQEVGVTFVPLPKSFAPKPI